MEVNSILEAFAISYGWEVYRLFFLFLLIIGAPLYPLISITHEAFNQQIERGAEPDQVTRVVLWRYWLYFFVIFVALVPTIELEFEQAELRGICGTTPLSDMQNDSVPTGLQLSFSETRAPFAPWLAMQIASGLRGVIAEQLPCVSDLTAVNQALRTLNIDNADNAQALIEEQDRFAQECHAEALSHYQRVVRGTYGSEAASQVQQSLDDAISAGETNRSIILSTSSSSFFRDNFYQIPPYCSNNEADPLFDYCNGLPIKAQGPVIGITSADTELLSQRQRAVGETIPTCEEWFNAPDTGLADRLYDAAIEASRTSDAVLQIGSAGRLSSGFEAGFDPNYGLLVFWAEQWLFDEDRDESLAALGEDPDVRDAIIERLQINQSDSRDRNLIQNSTGETAVNALGGIAVASVFTDVFGVTDGANPVGQVVEFYTTAAVFKAISTLFLPMLLMSVFMFWGFYVIFSQAQLGAMFQGLGLIFVLMIIPGIWLIAEQFDDQIYIAMFGTDVSINDMLSNPIDNLQRLLLDGVTTAFYVFMPLVLIYLVIAAGGTSSESGRLTNDGVNRPSSNGANRGGRGTAPVKPGRNIPKPKSGGS